MTPLESRSRSAALAAVHDPLGRNSSKSPDGVAVSRGAVAKMTSLSCEGIFLGRAPGRHIDLPQEPNGRLGGLLTQIKCNSANSPRIPVVDLVRVSAMFNASDLTNELQALKGEVSRLLNTSGDGMFDAAKNRADALADQIKAALNDLGETLNEEEGHVEKLISERPITTIASAFALGIVVGFMLRRH